METQALPEIAADWQERINRGVSVILTNEQQLAPRVRRTARLLKWREFWRMLRWAGILRDLPKGGK